MSNRLAPTQSRAATGGRDDWRTPPELIAAVCDRWKVSIGLDVACTSSNMVDGAAMGFRFDLGENGLDLDWTIARKATLTANASTSVVWCNPPYSRVGDWMARARNEAHMNGVRSVCLVPVRTDTGWWTASVHRPVVIPYGAARVTLLKGRVKFIAPPGSDSPAAQSAPFPSCLVWYEPGHAAPPQYEVWDWSWWLKNRQQMTP